MAGLVLYAGLALVFLRADFGGGAGLPQGTNALNTYTIFVFEQHHGLSVWLGPYTDWGQPLPQYPGVDPQNLLALTRWVGPTEYIRSVEFLAFIVSGLSTCWAVLELGGTRSAGVVAGTFYLLMAEVTQFFEGHVPAMISLALAPFLIVLVVRFFAAPALGRGLALASVLFLLVSVGDLGFLYKFLFFAALCAVGLIVYRLVRRPYSRGELVVVAASASLLLVLVLPWLVAYLGGVRPEFTAGIVYSTQPFSQTAGQPAYAAFIGSTGENSFTRFGLGSPTYALDYALTAPLFAIIPGAVGAYAIVLGGWRERLLYASGLLAMLFSMGPSYAGVGLLTQAFYQWVPLFDTDPSLVHWSAYYILVVAVLLGLGLSSVERALTALSSRTADPLRDRSAEDKLLRAYRRLARRRGWARRQGPSARSPRPSVTLALAASVIVAAGVLPALENWEAFTEPPGLFQFPSNYTAGFSYIDSQPALGGVLSVPFGNLGERTPWGKVSSSAQLDEGLETGRNLAIFEAGTPPSLALDRVSGDGLAHGDSDYLAKFWNATGIQYVVGTDYPNWTYASDPVYYPVDSYEGLTHQVGLGTPVYRYGYQTVYQIPDPAGNVTVFPQYYVYDGNESLLYEIFDQTWYTGAQALVCLCDLSGGAVSTVIEHAAAFVTDPVDLQEIPAQVWADVTASGIPLVVLIDAPDFAPASVRLVADPWGASNGLAFQPRSPSTPASTIGFLGALVAHGYVDGTVSLLASAPAPSEIAVGASGPRTSWTAVDVSSQGSLTPAGAGPRAPVGVTAPSAAGLSSTHDAPRAGSASALSAGEQTGGPPGSGLAGEDFSPTSAVPVDVGTGSSLRFLASASVLIDTVALTFGPFPALAEPRDDIYAAQPDVTDERFTLEQTGWSLVQLGQVYASLWTLLGPVSAAYHITAEVGLNAWLVESSGNRSLQIVYQGSALVIGADVAQGVALIAWAAVVTTLVRRARRPRREPAVPTG